MCLLIGCNESDVTPEQSLSESKSKAFVHINISQTLSTRAGLHARRVGSNYEHGIEQEQAIHDLTMIFFTRNHSESESDARMLYATTLTDPTSSQVPVSDEITQSHGYIVEVEDEALQLPSNADQIDVFVVANSVGVVDALGNGRLRILGVTYDIGSLTFGMLRDSHLSHVGSLDHGMLMTSAPIADIAGGNHAPSSYTVTTLTTVNPEKIFYSSADAADNAPIEVFVERAAAKVQVTTASTLRLKTDEGISFSIASIRWGVENENSEFFLARHISSDLTLGSDVAGTVHRYRFIDEQPLRQTLSAYRTFWAEDMNYDSGVGLIQHYIGDAPILPNSIAEVAYTQENTIDVEHMTQDISTGVVMSIAFNDGQDFYILSKDGNGVIYDENTLLLNLLALAEETPMMKTWRLSYPTTHVSASLVHHDGTAFMSDGTTLIPKGQVSVRIQAADMPSETAQLIAKAVEGLTKIYFYENGRAYYKVMIRHFGDEDTPLPQSALTAQTYAGLYGNPADEARFLGRYGVVRNTWYNLEIEAVKSIGTAVIPEWTEEPDDETLYMKIKIVILPWLIHEQNLDF